jgi:hypothetical protein
MSKIVKKADLDVLIESTLKKAGIVKAEPKEVVTESKVIVEPKKEVINEDFKKELEKFNKLTNFKH